MLKYIIGGVALVAIGYGLKTYADEYGIFDEISDERDKLDPALSEDDEGEGQNKYHVEYAANI